MQRFAIGTWNVNSLKQRLELLQRLCDQCPLDILCLQETKTKNEDFPHSALAELGFPFCAHRGEKSYNGVAILSKFPLLDVFHLNFCAKQDSRHIAARVAFPDYHAEIWVHSLYVPAGGYVPDSAKNPKFAHKLRFVEEMAERFPPLCKQHESSLLLGDLNIAPLPEDVWSHEKLRNVVSHTPAEVERLTRALQSSAWLDCVRSRNPPPQKIYSWWSYRFPKWRESDYGRRLDHIWASPTIASRLESTSIVKEARGWPHPSDHVPVLAEFSLNR